jgi:hypothetical protein
MSLEIFYEKVAEGLLTSTVWKFSSRSVERIPVTHARLEGKSQCSCRMSAERSKRQTGEIEEMHYNVLQKMRSWTLYRAVFRNVSLKIELLRVKVTNFTGFATKTLYLHNV